MITAEQLRELKKGNLTVNADKSKSRIPDAFKSATKAQKDEIVNATGLNANAFYAVSKSGAASPKVVLSLAQILNISPYYLIGEIDEKETCDAVHLAELFKKCSGGKVKKSDKPAVVKEKPAKEKIVAVKEKPAKEKAVAVKEKTANEKPVAVKPKADKPAPAPKKEKAEKAKPVKAAKSNKIDDEAYLLLLKAVAVRAKFGGTAKETYDEIVALLIK